MKKKVLRKAAAGLLAASVIATSGVLPASAVQAAGTDSKDQQWAELQEILTGVTGRYTEAPDKDLVECSQYSAGMLLGNGSFGVVSDARENEQSFYFAGQDVWNNNQKIMNAQLQIVPLEINSLVVTASESNSGDGSKGAEAVLDGDPLTYWITYAQNKSAGDKWLAFDFGKVVTIDQWTTIHRGYMDTNSQGEHNTRYNTRDFSLQVSEDGQTWEDVDVVEGNEDYIVDRKLNSAVTSRYFRINITAAVQPGQETYKEEGDRDVARISEVDFLYNGKSVIEQDEDEGQTFSFKKSCSAGVNTSQEAAFDSNPYTMWRSETQVVDGADGKTRKQDKYIQVSSDQTFTFDKVEINLIGTLYPELSCYNIWEYDLQISDDGKTWNTLESVAENTESVNTFEYSEPVTTKYLRLYTSNPVAPEYKTKHYENDMTNACVVDINLYSGGVNVINPPKEDDGSYYHEQDILNAEVRSQQEFNGESVTFTSWTSDSRNMLYTDITLDEDAAGPLELKASLTAPEGYHEEIGSEGDVIWLTRYAGSDYVSRTATAVKVLDGESRVENDSLILTLKPGETMKVVSYAHSSSGLTKTAGLAAKDLSTVLEEAVTRVDAVSEADIEEEHGEHLEWWKDYWMKSYINTDDTILQRYYYGALYALGCCIRPTPEGAEQPNVPSGALGVWQTNDTCASSGRGYTNYNYESPYYGIYSSNRSDLMEPYYEDASVRMSIAQNTVAKLGYRGAQFQRSIVPVYPFYAKADPIEVSDTKNVSKLPTDQKSNVMLFTQPLIWEWEYNLNDETLEEYVYPMVKQTVEFYVDFVVKEDDGKYWIYNSANNELEDKTKCDINPILDIGYIQSHFASFIEMAEYLGRDEELAAQAQDVIDNLVEMPTSENAEPAKSDLEALGFDFGKEVYLSAYFSQNQTQVNASNCAWGMYIYEGNQPVALEGVVHPAENVSLASDPELVQLAKDTFEYFNPMYYYYRGGAYNGFPKSFTIAARLGLDGDYVLANLEKTIMNIWRENLTCNNGSPHGLESSGAIEAVNSMLLQNEEDELRVFPSWAESTSIKFVDLKAKGAFLVSSEYDADTKNIPYVKLTSEKGSTVNFVSPWENGAVITDENGNKVEAQISATKNTGELLYTFETTEGASYTITENDTPYSAVESVTVTADAQAVVVGGTIQAQVSVTPEDASVTAVKWSSSDKTVATVDQKGVITGVKEGTAEITAASVISPEVKGSITIEVKSQLPENVEISGEGVEDGKFTLSVNEKKTLDAQVLPENVTDKTVVWSSSNPAVAEVSSSGTVKGRLSGTAVITAQAAADESITASVEVTVKAASDGYRALTYYPDEANRDDGNTKSKSYTMAYSFSVDRTVTLTELGIYDQNGDGVFGNTGSEVGIWKIDGSTPLASAEVPKGTKADENGYCYVALDEPIELEAGEYEIAVYYPKGSEDNWFHSAFTKPFETAPQITYLLSGYVNSATELTKPTVKEGERPYHCMNFKFIDKSRLSEQIEAVSGLKEADYTEETWSAFEKALSEAQSVLKDSLDQAELDTAAQTLKDAAEALEEAQASTVSKKTLEYFLNRLKEHVEAGDADGVVESVQKLIDEAIALGEEVMADKNATKDEVTNASMMIVKAIHALDMKAADKTDLEMALELAGMIDLADYTEAGRAEFQAAKSQAETVMADGDAMQAEADSAWSALVEAMEALRLKADKSVLEALLADLEDIDLTRYTEESVSVYMVAFEAANAVMVNEPLSVDDQQTVDNAVTTLKSAVKQLKLIEGTGNTDVDDPDVDDPKADDPAVTDPDSGEGTDNPGSEISDGAGTNSSTSDAAAGDRSADGSGDSQKDGNAPKTGDEIPAGTLAGMLGLSAVAAAVAVTTGRRRRRN